MNQFLDITGASGSVYRFHRLSDPTRLPATAGNFIFTRSAPDGDELICCGTTHSLTLARAAWKTAVEHEVTSIFVRLNISRLIRAAEHDDIVARQKPILAITDQG